MTRLHRGWRSIEEAKADATDAASGSGGDVDTRRARRQYRAGQPRESDMRALRRFEEQQHIG